MKAKHDSLLSAEVIINLVHVKHFFVQFDARIQNRAAHPPAQITVAMLDAPHAEQQRRARVTQRPSRDIARPEGPFAAVHPGLDGADLDGAKAGSLGDAVCQISIDRKCDWLGFG